MPFQPDRRLSMFTITLSLNQEMMAVLLRCLHQGEFATSHAEMLNGEAAIVENNIRLMRNQIIQQWSNQFIYRAAKTKQ